MRDLDDISRFLHSGFGWDVSAIEEVGRGAWSTAYGFVGDGRALVIRIGRHLGDFEADLAAAAHRSPELPIPEVLHIGPFAGEHCCVSTFAAGTPLEACSAAAWQRVIPSLVDALEAMRRCAPGGPVRSWNDQLLAADKDHAGTRLAGWREKIDRSPDAVTALDDAMTQLRSIDLRVELASIQPTLTHNDLVNRNTHVDQGSISGIFDWGCMRWGDHLYDLAWFDFWSSWYPELDVGLLRAELDRRWHNEGYEIANRGDRERACLLHIAADHLVYNAVIDSPTGLDELLARMVDLELI